MSVDDIKSYEDYFEFTKSIDMCSLTEEKIEILTNKLKEIKNHNLQVINEDKNLKNRERAIRRMVIITLSNSLIYSLNSCNQSLRDKRIDRIQMAQTEAIYKEVGAQERIAGRSLH